MTYQPPPGPDTFLALKTIACSANNADRHCHTMIPILLGFASRVWRLPIVAATRRFASRIIRRADARISLI